MTLFAGRQAATLAEALRARRRAAALSQERLAERSGVSVRTISNLESGRVRAPRMASVAALADALGLEDIERADFVGLVVGDGTNGQPAGGAQPSAPSPLTPLVGRDADVEGVITELSAGTPRLMTLTGLAGVGKTRLATEVARQLHQRGRSVWWVPLASIADVRHVLDAVAAAVGAPAIKVEAIGSRMGDEPLLVLDNLEHLDGVGDVVVDLLGRLPALRVLATSRAPVGVQGEYEWPVAPLEVPDGGESDPAVLLSLGSVQLFVDRVRASIPHFELTGANSPVVAEVCRALDGLPLAVELAARQWRVRGGVGLARSVRRDPLALRELSDPAATARTSLLSALEASYGLLDDAVQRSFGCLSVLPAGWDVDAASAVIGSEHALDHLDRLVALGLVTTSDGDGHTEPRFSMLPTIRAFAATRAERQGTAERAMTRHAAFFHARLVGAEAGDLLASAPLEADRDNLRAALDWFVDHDPRAGLEMATRLYSHWFRHGREVEGLGYLERLLVDVDDAGLVAKAQMQAATLAHIAGRYEVAGRLASSSLAAYQDLGDTHGRAEALGTLGMTALFTDPVAAVSHTRDAVALAAPLGDPGLLAWLSLRLAVAVSQLGRLDEAIEHAERALHLAGEHDLQNESTRPEARAAAVLASVYVAEWLWLKGDLVQADRMVDAAKPAIGSPGDPLPEAAWLVYRAVVSASLGDVTRSAAAVSAIAERAGEAESPLMWTWATWARGELELVQGDLQAAATSAREAVAKEAHGYPLNRMTFLSVLALAAEDIDTAARTVRAVELIRDRYGIPLPATLSGRLVRAQERWIVTDGADAWAERIAVTRNRSLDDLIDDVLQPPATRLDTTAIAG